MNPSNDIQRPPEPAAPSHFVAIGASAGGLEAIEAFFTHMPADSGMAFIVIQHLSPDHKSFMVELLAKKTTMKVLRAENNMQVEANHVYLIPPKKNLTIFHGRLLLNEQDQDHRINLPIDIFTRSLAEDQKEKAVTVILSGTGSDGTRGVRAIKEYNGMVMVQKEDTAKFDGMPRAAISTGLADFILSPEQMPQELMAYAQHPYESSQTRADRVLEHEDSLTKIFAELREKTRVDFTFYKPSTINRRIERRIAVTQSSDIDEYLHYLHQHSDEVLSLYRELLIGVTSFFRDPDVWKILEEELLPDLIRRDDRQEIRCWVAGCSTGEEAYTLAMILKEAMANLEIQREVKIFATDIDQNAIFAAGGGIYPESIAADLDPRLLSKYFFRKGDAYHVARHIREMMVFAQHNLVKDPPFTKIDLVCCRNLLIYLQPVLQQKALQMFNFSLKPKGLLVLGSSETVGEMLDYFTPIDQRNRIYEGQGKEQPLGQLSASPLIPSTPMAPGKRHDMASRPIERHITGREENAMINRFLDILSEQYVPLSVIVNENMEVLYTMGNADGLFKLPPGRVVYDISKMISRELSIPITTGLQKVFRSKEPLSYTNIRFQDDDEEKLIHIKIIPLPKFQGQPTMAAVFLEIRSDQTNEKEQPLETDTYDIEEETRQRLKDLEQELQFTKDNLQTTIEELETSNEELQATNEELLASNEELQSTNEELQSTNEQLQSTNEELYTVNAEYQNKINELTELNNDVDNLLTSSRIGTLILDEDLQIRRFSPEIEKIFLIMETDINRPITHIAHRLENTDPIEAIRNVQASDKTSEQEVRTQDGRYYLMRVLPYMIAPQTSSGVVVTFVDVTDIRQTRADLQENIQTHGDIIEHMPAGLFLYKQNESGELVLQSSNPEAERLTGITAKDFAGRSFDQIWPNARETGLTEKFLDVLETGKTAYLEDVRYEDRRLSGAYRISVFKLPGSRLAVSFEDITARTQMHAELEASEKKYRELFETMAQGAVYQSASGDIISANPAAERILGLSFDQMKGRTSMDPRWKATREDGTTLPGDQHPAMVALRTGKPVTGFVMGIFNPMDEKHHWILANAMPRFKDGEDKPYEVYATFDDITQLVQAEEHARSAKDHLDFTYQVAGLAWWEWYPQTGKVNISEHKANMIGFSLKEAGDTLEWWTRRIHPDDHQEAMDAMRRHLSGDESHYKTTYRLRAKDDSYIALTDIGEVAERTADGKPLRVIGTVSRADSNSPNN